MYYQEFNGGQTAWTAMVKAFTRFLKSGKSALMGHSERLQGLAVAFGRSMGLPEEHINNLSLLAQFGRVKSS